MGCRRASLCGAGQATCPWRQSGPWRSLSGIIAGVVVSLGSVAIEDDKVSSPELVHLVTCCVIQASHLSLAGQSCTKDTSRNILRLFR